MENLPPPQSYVESLEQHRRTFDAGLKRGDFSPLLYPQRSLGTILLIGYLVIPQRRFPLFRYARIPTFAAICCLEISTIITCRSRNASIGYAVGLISATSIMISAALLVFTDPQQDFRRIQSRQKRRAEDHSVTQRKQSVSGMSTAVDPVSMGQRVEPRNDHQANGHIPGTSDTSRRSDEYYWQSFPLKSFRERLGWVADLTSNLRGIGWNWQSSALVGPPPEVQNQLDGKTTERRQTPAYATGPAGNRTYFSRKALLRARLTEFIAITFLIDICKLVMMRDPYFWGLTDHPPPAYLPRILRDSGVLVRVYRLLVTLCGVYISMTRIYAMGALLAVGVLGVKRLGVNGEPWMYPDCFGHFYASLENGLAGWWGGWWHQSFRYGFGAPSAWIFWKLGANRRSPWARYLQLMVAFTLSGMLHACGAYTSLRPTKPLKGPLLFFSLQPLGITLQAAMTNLLTRSGIADRCPKAIRLLASFVYVHLWFYLTGPILADDLARAGIWTVEPNPISLLRVLGFGLKGEDWWCWQGLFPRWHRGDSWWNSGFML